MPRFRVRERLRKGFAQRRRSCCQVDEWIIPPDQCPMFKLQPNRFIIFNILYTLYFNQLFMNLLISFPFNQGFPLPFVACGRFGVWQRVIRSQEADPPGGPGHRTNDFKKWHDDTTPQIPSEISECSFLHTLQAIVCWMPKRNAWKYCICLHEYYFIFPYTL